jgi:hypothetical protein
MTQLQVGSPNVSARQDASAQREQARVMAAAEDARAEDQARSALRAYATPFWKHYQVRAQAVIRQSRELFRQVVNITRRNTRRAARCSRTCGGRN